MTHSFIAPDTNKKYSIEIKDHLDVVFIDEDGKRYEGDIDNIKAIADGEDAIGFFIIVNEKDHTDHYVLTIDASDAYEIVELHKSKYPDSHMED